MAIDLRTRILRLKRSRPSALQTLQVALLVKKRLVDTETAAGVIGVGDSDDVLREETSAHEDQ
jgi:hypothetical protein